MTLGTDLRRIPHLSPRYPALSRKYSGFNVQIKTFNQSRYPRINKESLMPVAR